jgi:glucosamine--fructose-6-phosphate aminotransferase (isomerizing)
LAPPAAPAAAWTEDKELAAALTELPDRQDTALNCDWSAALDAFEAGAFVVARGPALAIAQEAALKLKETCYLHAEALSAAEIRHGPFAVLEQGFAVLGFALDDAGGVDTGALASPMADAGARVLIASPQASDTGLHLPLPAPLHSLLDPIVAITAFYPFAEALARRLGIDPDHPRHLRKVTRTV